MVMNVVPGVSEASLFVTAPFVAAAKSGHNPFDNQQYSNGRNCMLELRLWTAKQF
jgi:hypothetical protein